MLFMIELEVSAVKGVKMGVRETKDEVGFPKGGGEGSKLTDMLKRDNHFFFTR